MLSLIKKDLIVLRRMIIFAAGYSVFIFLAFSNPVFRPFIYIMGAVVIGYIFVLSVIQAEFKNNSDVILNSLPVSRKDIVSARFVSIFILTALALAILGSVGLILRVLPLPLEVPIITLRDALISLGLIVLMSALFLPAYHLTAGKWLQILNIIFFMVVFFAPATITQILVEHTDKAWALNLVEFHMNTPWLLPSLSAAVLALMLLLSFTLTLIIYRKRDF